ncbi:GNAT family N-acetyltransferase [Sinimarinibacterium sp. CAU 1509]|uniref:GNAT family N-acetyltransferase n=1 Tax=Sinimarinibacterium sp. CAU 1509 TaxID=2562283 RepID=UPI0010AC4D5D|nr:GNAT family N-acetyltransferase [Sinimarinibacterium sp. CAU 1509]TJY55180.1 GNAT family N-acetyltransferase [Sinimarinibacterium sp. CAU 1509]
MRIESGGLHHPAVIALLQSHLQAAALHSPAESIHALDLDALRSPEITFWSVWNHAELMGCGALKALDAWHGEIKSMRTASPYLRRGVAAALMERIVDEATQRSYRQLSLETGSADAYIPARRLYAKFGFVPCGPFADYVEDPYSLFMTRML